MTRRPNALNTCILGQVWYLIVSIPDLCTITYFFQLLVKEFHFIATNLGLLSPRHKLNNGVQNFIGGLCTDKGIYLSKALNGWIFFLCKQKMLFYRGDGYLWLHCCMNNVYISHRSLYAPTYSFWAIRSMLICLFRVTSWFDTVWNIVTRWVNFRKKTVAWTWTTIIPLQHIEVFSPTSTNFW